jgi:crossover junction endodeoxyribonuclease RuvC
LFLEKGLGMRIVIGIDPGIKGAVAAIRESDRSLIELVDCPTRRADGKTLYDVPEMAHTIRRLSLLGEATVILEQAQSMPGQGVVSMFSAGRSFGLWEGILSALDVPFRTVRPNVWTKRLFTGMPGESKGKFRSIQFALRMFPGIMLTPQRGRTPKDGRADAACLAYWGTVA